MLGLEYILELHNITQQELADEIGVSKQSVSKWVTGNSRMPQKRLEILSEKFNVSQDYLSKRLKDCDYKKSLIYDILYNIIDNMKDMDIEALESIKLNMNQKKVELMINILNQNNTK